MSANSSSDIPSQVTSSYWLFCKPPHLVPHPPCDAYSSGKWMLFVNAKEMDSNGLTELDRAWPQIKQLVSNGSLSNAKCTTAFGKEDKTYPENGIIVCYTPKSKDKKGVKAAAEAIRNVVDYQKDLYYKTDEATRDGLYRIKGDRGISLYKHTVSGDFYERDEDTWDWILVPTRKRKTATAGVKNKRKKQ